MSKPDILAYTCCHHDRGNLVEFVRHMRATASNPTRWGEEEPRPRWFNWLFCLGAPSPRLQAEAEALLNDPERLGIQYLKIWPENRGQHHAMAVALKIARKEKYTWLLRLDDDVTARTKGWLDKMITRLEELRDLSGDGYYRLVASPRIIGLKHPIHPEGQMDKGQKYPVEVVPILGGVCRLHPVEILDDYEPPIYDPVGRGDPQSIVRHVRPTSVGLEGEDRGLLVRFPDIRMIHKTEEIEAKDTDEQRRLRRMSRYWPWLGAEV